MRTLSILFTIAILTIVQSCGSSGPTIDQFKTQLESEGFEVKQEAAPYYSILKADGGKRLFVKGQRFEVYRFDLSKEIAEESIRKISSKGMNGKPAIRNGPLLLFKKPGHPDWQTIKTMFQNL